MGDFPPFSYFLTSFTSLIICIAKQNNNYILRAHINHTVGKGPTPGPLYLLFPLPETPFPQISISHAPSPSSGLQLYDTWLQYGSQNLWKWESHLMVPPKWLTAVSAFFNITKLVQVRWTMANTITSMAKSFIIEWGCFFFGTINVLSCVR